MSDGARPECYPCARDGPAVRNRFLLLLLGLLGLRLATLPILPILDPSESRYAVVARDMLHSGDFVTPMIWASGEYIPFFSKPPLLFWLEAGLEALHVRPTLADLEKIDFGGVLREAAELLKAQAENPAASTAERRRAEEALVQLFVMTRDGRGQAA